MSLTAALWLFLAAGAFLKLIGWLLPDISWKPPPPSGGEDHRDAYRKSWHESSFL